MSSWGHPRGQEKQTGTAVKKEITPSQLWKMPPSLPTLRMFLTYLVMSIPQGGNIVLRHASSRSRSSRTHRSNTIDWQLWFPRNETLCIVSTIDPQRRRRWRRLHGLCEAIPRHDSNAKNAGKTAED
jgi:hypothetical protein